METIRRPSYIPPYSSRKNFCYRIREIEKEIHELKTQGDWESVSRLQNLLRNAWWGYKRYTK
mgnify:CR=1 FL=1